MRAKTLYMKRGLAFARPNLLLFFFSFLMLSSTRAQFFIFFIILTGPLETAVVRISVHTWAGTHCPYYTVSCGTANCDFYYHLYMLQVLDCSKESLSR